jgi:hypothetical protein
MFDKCNKFVHVYPKSRLIFLMSWCVWARAGLATLLTGDKGVLERIKCSIATLHNCVLGAPGQRILDDIFNQKFQLAVGAKSTDMSNTTCWRSFFMFFALWMTLFPKRQDATHEPECSHVKHTCETSYLNSLVKIFPVTVPVRW